MKSLNILLVIISLFYSSHIFGQTQICDYIERTDAEMALLPWYGNNAYLDHINISVDSFIDLDDPIENRTVNNCSDIENPVFIPIRFWIYEENASDPGIPSNFQLQRMMDQLNRLYQNSNMNVRFFMVCPQFEINPDALEMNDWEAFWNSFGGNHSAADAINVHIVQNLEGAGGTYYKFGDFVVVRRNVYQSTAGASTLAHEIGHYLGLEHTHRNFDQGECSQEAVSRNRRFTFWQFFSCFGKTGLICDKNGDGLCDTPADPNLGEGGLGSKVDSGCNYTDSETDNWGDAYDPNTRNLMSYSSQTCRQEFSISQVLVMWQWILYSHSREFIQLLDLNLIDPDKYEPDNSDEPGVPRLISIGETQCHSFDLISFCQDEVDWLRIDNSNGLIGTYVIDIDEVEGADYPVDGIKVFNTDASGNRTSEISVTSTQNGTVRSYVIPCEEIVNDFLIEVDRNEIEEGKYAISLRMDPAISMSNFETDLVCQGDEYQILNLPSNATVTWSSSFNITISNTSGSSTTINNYSTGSFNYWIQAVIQLDGCQYTLRKEFIGTNGPVANFSIIELLPACYPSSHYGRYATDPPTNVSWSINYGNIIPYDGMILVSPSSTGWFTLSATTKNDCGNTLTVSEDFYVESCYDCIPRISISPNPATSSISVEIEKDQSISDDYQILVTDMYSTLKYQNTTSNNNFNIDVSHYGNGIYRLHVYLGECYKSVSFIVN